MDHPGRRVGQGNGAGPQIWALVSTPILNMMRAEGFNVMFKMAISGKEIKFVGYAFMDDTDLVVNVNDKEADSKQVAQRMQEALDHWEGGLRATGGAIVPEKSYWYLVDFQWKQGEWRYAMKEEAPAMVYVRDPEGVWQTLERLGVKEAR